MPIARIPQSLAGKPNPSALGSRKAAKSGRERTGPPISYFDDDQRSAIARHDVDLVVPEVYVAFQHLPAPRCDQFGNGALCPNPSRASDIVQYVHAGFIGTCVRIRARIRTRARASDAEMLASSTTAPPSLHTTEPGLNDNRKSPKLLIANFNTTSSGCRI